MFKIITYMEIELSKNQNYENYYRDYYFRNRDYILKRTRLYRKRYNFHYYHDHKEEILEQRRLKRLRDKVNNQKIDIK